MGSSSKPTQPTSQNITQSTIPAYARPYFEDVLARTQAESYRPYQPYGGQRIAGFTDAETQAQKGIMGLTTPGQFGTATQMATAAGNYTPGQFNVGSFTDSGTASKYMSPYMQNVVDVQKQAALRDAKQANLLGNLGASRQGTYGGARQLLAQTERERALRQQLGQIQATGSQAAYEAAQRQFEAEQERGLQAQQYGEQSRQFGSTQGLNAAESLGQLGTSQQQADLQRLNAINAAGETQRGLEQTRLNTAYDDFQRQRDYPMDQLGRYAGIIQGLPMTPNTTSTQYAQAPSALAGLAGTAAAAYGGYKTFAADGGEMRSYNNGGLVALAEGGVGSGGEGSVFKLRDDPKELLYSTGGDPTKLQTALQQGADPAAVAYAGLLRDRMVAAMAMAPQQTTLAGLVNPQPPQPQGQPQQGLGAIAPQQPPMDPTQSQPPMMAANGGLMNINLPDDYYDEDSYAHGGIAHFAVGGMELAEQIKQSKKQQVLNQVSDPFAYFKNTPASARKSQLVMDIHNTAMQQGTSLNIEDLNGLTLPELEAIAEGKAPPPTPSSDMFGNTERDENSFLFSAPEENTPRTATDKPQVTPAAPQGLAQLQEVDMSTMPTRTPEKVDYMAKAKEYFAGVLPSGMTDEEMAKDKEQRGYEALTQFGLNLAGTKNPNFLGGVGEAGAATMPAIIEARTAQNEAKAARRKEERDMKIAQIQTALGLEKDDAEKVFKQQELALKKQEVALQAKLTAAQIDNLGKPDNIYDLMESNPAVATRLIAIQNAKDLTPTARAGLIKSLIESVTDPKQKADLQNMAMSMVMGGNTGASATLDFNALTK